MKPIRLLSLALLAALLAACSQDPLSDALPEPPAPADPHKIPVEKALGELEELLRAIDGPETRSGGARRVASVEALGDSALARATRAGHDAAAAAEIGDLVYIANFQNGEGYAILGADDRIESVIAVTERGSLTPAQLAAAANGQYDGVEAPPVVPEIGDYLIERIGGIHKYDSLASIFPTYEVSYGPWEFADKKGPYVRTKWGQGYPLNLYTPEVDGAHCPLGCVALATGQIIAAHYFDKYYLTDTRPEVQILGGFPIRWNSIFNSIRRFIEEPDAPRIYYNENDHDLEPETIAGFLSGAGVAMGMKYGIDGSRVGHEAAARLLRAMGFNDTKVYKFTTGRMHEMVIDRGLPTYVSGFRSTGGGHAFLVDGAITMRRMIYNYNPQTNKTETGYDKRQLYHCNYGWFGTCDGYYHPGMVVCPGKPVHKDLGDGDDASQIDYVKDKVIIYYNL